MSRECCSAARSRRGSRRSGARPCSARAALSQHKVSVDAGGPAVRGGAAGAAGGKANAPTVSVSRLSRPSRRRGEPIGGPFGGGHARTRRAPLAAAPVLGGGGRRAGG